MKKTKQKRNQSTVTNSRGVKITSWVAVVVSLAIAYLAIKIFANDMGGFRSCAANNAGLTVVDCGKQSFTTGDYILLAFVIASVLLFGSLIYASIRSMRTSK